MVNYDSDSSGGEDGELTKTDVVLGYASKEVESNSDPTSHIGGRPEWLDPSTPPSAAVARCGVCRDMMVLLLQINGSFPEGFPEHERRLYVWACRRKTCRRKEGCLKALRGVRVSKAKNNDRREGSREKDTMRKEDKKVVTSTGMGESLFGTNPTAMASEGNPFTASTSVSNPTNPFSSSYSTPSNPFANLGLLPASNLAAKSPQPPTSPSDLPQTFSSVLSLNSPPKTSKPVLLPEPWPLETALPQPYPLYYIEGPFPEMLDKVSQDIPLPQQTMGADDDGGASEYSSQKEDKDIYESTIDKTFQKFADRLAQNPEQVIRYEYKGSPLLYSKTDAVGKLLAPAHSQNTKIAFSGGGQIPRCGNCGAGRVFELQLTPHAIMELEVEEMSLDGMDWGTIILGVCEKDCQPNGTGIGEANYVEEWAGVQWEELESRSR